MPFRSGSADLGTAGAHAASLGWAIGDTHAYLSVAHEGNIMKAVIGGGDSGKITWYKELAFKDDISDLSTVYYPYSGRGQMSIGADGRPILANTYGILFKKIGGERIEGIYMESHDRIVVGGSSGTNVPVIIYSKLNVDSISTTREQLGLLSYHPTDWTGVSNTQIGVGTSDSQLVFRSNSSDLLHYRDNVHCLIFDSYNFSRNLGTTSLNSSFNHFPMMAAQPANRDATTDRGYPIQQAGSLIVIPGVYNGSSQIYGTFNSNRWFVRSGSPISNNENEHTAWKELATTTHLSGYLPLTGGTLTERLTVPRINTNYIESIDGNALLAYHQVGIDGVTNAQVGIGTVANQMILRSSNTNLMHYKNGTQYTILDTSNIAALTIQFNGSTNTTYAPNAAKTVNITPAAIGAAASSHTHNYAASPSAGGPATYILDSGKEGNNKIQLAYGGYGLTASTASYLVGINKTLVNGCRVFRDIAPSEVRTLIEAAPSSHTHTKSQITDFPSSMPASDVYAWAKASSKPSYSWSEITSKPSTFTPSSHTHPLSDISDLQASWDALLKAAPSAYVTRWPSWSEVTSKPSFATVATSGSYNDLSNKPSIPSAETAATIMSKINSQSEITFTKHVVCSAGAGLQSTSDIRFKSNFNSLPDDTLNKVLNAPEFTYNWKDETTTSIGTSAQYWEDKIPELVHEMEDGTKTFSYERYTVVLQKALKEEHRLREEEKKRFKEEIDSLNTRLNAVSYTHLRAHET